MIEKIKNYWSNYGFELLAGLSFIIIILLCIFNYLFKDKGTYSNIGGNIPLILFGENEYKSNKNIDNINNINNIEYIQHTPNDSKLEIQSKLILESIFKKPFYKIRPNFLRNDVTGYNLEIDLYNDDLKLGVEVQGDQHYKFTPFFHKNKEHFLNQRYRDEMKKEKCKKEGITLIEIPYKVGEKKLKSYIIEQLRLEQFIL